MGQEGIEPPTHGNSDFSIAGAVRYAVYLLSRLINNYWKFI